MSVIAYLAVWIASGFWGSSAEPALSIDMTRPDDEAVIEAAMLSFYPKSDWNNVDWSRGDFVVLTPKYSTKSRPSFLPTIDECIHSLEQWPKEWVKKYPVAYRKSLSDAKILQGIKEEIRSDVPPFSPVETRSISLMSFDPRIITDDPKITWYSHWNETISNREGKKGKPRALVTITPPGYSADGQFAVILGHAPWSIHGAALEFFLRRTNTGWEVVYVEATYYV